MGKIEFLGKRSFISFLNTQAFRQEVTLILQNTDMALGVLSYVLVSDEEMLEINRAHLQHDYYTDIITFNLSDDASILDAEIYISYDRVIENAKSLSQSISDEFLRVMLHGLLHLCGFNDKRMAERKVMRLMETHCVNLYREIVRKSRRST